MIHRFKDENRWLSNMALVKIEFQGNTYSSVEHAYQSAKNKSQEWKDICISEFNPYKIKILSRDIEVREDWDEVKLLVMEECLIEKFKQEPFKSQLLATGNENIQEGNEWGDKFWGVDLTSSPNIGENHLGRLIMKTRENLREL